MNKILVEVSVGELFDKISILEIKKDMNVSIEEVITANEKVVFKLPKELN